VAQKLELGTALSRAFRLVCPRCGRGKLFLGLFKMHAACAHCNLRYEREPGYFLGSTYINYGVTALTITVAYVLLHFLAGFSDRAIAIPLLAFCVLFPPFFFRYARSLWLALDCYFDASALDDDQP
jgi:uncharacterized protein (DUF983 family)